MIFKLKSEDIPEYVALRQRMLADTPWSFSADPANDRASNIDHLQSQITDPDFVLFGAKTENALVGSTGFMHQKNPKFRHRATIWGVYVAPEARGNGFGYAMISQAILEAKTREIEFLDLGVSSNAPFAISLYESLGFKTWGREPETTQIGNERYDELYMTLRLQAR